MANKKPRKGSCIGFVLGCGYIEDAYLGQTTLVHADGAFLSMREAATSLATDLYLEYCNRLRPGLPCNCNCPDCPSKGEPSTKEGFEAFVLETLTGTNDSSGFLYDIAWDATSLYGYLENGHPLTLLYHVPERAERFFTKFIPELSDAD